MSGSQAPRQHSMQQNSVLKRGAPTEGGPALGAAPKRQRSDLQDVHHTRVAISGIDLKSDSIDFIAALSTSLLQAATPDNTPVLCAIVKSRQHLLYHLTEQQVAEEIRAKAQGTGEERPLSPWQRERIRRSTKAQLDQELASMNPKMAEALEQVEFEMEEEEKELDLRRKAEELLLKGHGSRGDVMMMPRHQTTQEPVEAISRSISTAASRVRQDKDDDVALHVDHLLRQIHRAEPAPKPQPKPSAAAPDSASVEAPAPTPAMITAPVPASVSATAPAKAPAPVTKPVQKKETLSSSNRTDVLERDYASSRVEELVMAPSIVKMETEERAETMTSLRTSVRSLHKPIIEAAGSVGGQIKYENAPVQAPAGHAGTAQRDKEQAKSMSASTSTSPPISASTAVLTSSSTSTSASLPNSMTTQARTQTSIQRPATSATPAVVMTPATTPTLSPNNSSAAALERNSAAVLTKTPVKAPASTPVPAKCSAPTPTPIAVPGQAAKKPTPIAVPGQAARKPTPSAVPGQAPTPIAVPGQAVRTPTPIAIPGQAVRTPTPIAIPGQAVRTPTPIAVPGQTVRTPTPIAIPGQAVRTPTPIAVPNQAVRTPTPIAIPGQAVRTPTPIAIPGQAARKVTPIVVPGQSPRPPSAQVVIRTKVRLPGSAISSQVFQDGLRREIFEWIHLYNNWEKPYAEECLLGGRLRIMEHFMNLRKNELELFGYGNEPQTGLPEQLDWREAGELFRQVVVHKVTPAGTRSQAMQAMIHPTAGLSVLEAAQAKEFSCSDMACRMKATWLFYRWRRAIELVKDENDIRGFRAADRLLEKAQRTQKSGWKNSSDPEREIAEHTKTHCPKPLLERMEKLDLHYLRSGVPREPLKDPHLSPSKLRKREARAQRFGNKDPADGSSHASFSAASSGGAAKTGADDDDSDYDSDVELEDGIKFF